MTVFTFMIDLTKSTTFPLPVKGEGLWVGIMAPVHPLPPLRKRRGGKKKAT